MAPSLSAAIVHPLHLALLLLAMPLHPYMVVAQLTSRIKLTAGGDTLTPPAYITSPSGDFAFGFHALGSTNPSGFLLAIWFRFDSTVVWFATDAGSGSAVVAAGQSVLSVSTTGLVSLYNPGGNNPLWKPSSNYVVSHLVLNDTGNLQFIGGAGGNSVVWESFLNPTDTLLPGQSMLPGTKLQSRSADMGFSLGDFSFDVQNDGNIVMYRMDVPGGSGESANAYWNTATCCAGNTTLFFDVEPTAHLYYTLTNGRERKRNLTTPQPCISTSGLYQRAKLDADGLFRVFVHPKNAAGGGKGNDTWAVRNKVPVKVCETLTVGKRGMCGPNSYCVELTEERIDCECPGGYVFFDPQIRYKGCTPAFLPDSCDGKNHTAEFELKELPKTNWVSTVSDRMHKFITEEQCRSLCLNSCSCAAALFDGNNCTEAQMLLAGWQDNGTAMRTLIKVRAKKNPVQILPYVLMAVFAVLFLATTCILLVHCYITIKKETRNNSLSTRVFTRKELHRATNGFSELLGQGSFGKVYRGTVKSLQPPDVAVKELVVLKEKDFENEVRSIGQIHHRNLVRMIGYCKEGVHRMLVFEYMQGGTLADFITRSERPRWNLLAEAAIGIAKGMEYLHEGCKSKIIHCDIKPDNILFDDKQIPRITDFGIAKLLGDQKTQKTINQTIAGTKPYMAPEWRDGRDKVDSKVDVYSFGVVLLEIICCKRATGEQPAAEINRPPSTMFPLRAKVESSIMEGKAELLVGGEIEALADMESVERFARIAIWCLQKEPSARPTMRKVVQMLEGDLKVEPLPDPPMHPSFSAILPSGSSEAQQYGAPCSPGRMIELCSAQISKPRFAN